MFSFKITHTEIVDTGDKFYHIKISPVDMIYFGYIVESLEGYAFHTLLNKEDSIMYVEVVKDYIDEFEILLAKIEKYNSKEE